MAGHLDDFRIIGRKPRLSAGRWIGGWFIHAPIFGIGYHDGKFRFSWWPRLPEEEGQKIYKWNWEF